jgi:hypothetical protein
MPRNKDLLKGVGYHVDEINDVPPWKESHVAICTVFLCRCRINGGFARSSDSGKKARESVRRSMGADIADPGNVQRRLSFDEKNDALVHVSFQPANREEIQRTRNQTVKQREGLNILYAALPGVPCPLDFFPPHSARKKCQVAFDDVRSA